MDLFQLDWRLEQPLHTEQISSGYPAYTPHCHQLPSSPLCCTGRYCQAHSLCSQSDSRGLRRSGAPSWEPGNKSKSVVFVFWSTCIIYCIINIVAWSQIWLRLCTFHVTRMLCDVIGCRMTSMGGPSGAVKGQNVRSVYNKLIITDCSLKPLYCVCVCVHTSVLTCFLCADSELFAGLTTADFVVWIHTNAIDRSRMQLHYVGLVIGRGNFACSMLQFPWIYEETSTEKYIIPLLIKAHCSALFLLEQ